MIINNYVTSLCIFTILILFIVILQCILSTYKKYFAIKHYTILLWQQPHISRVIVSCAWLRFTLFCTVAHCTGVEPRDNRLHHMVLVRSRLDYLGLCKCSLCPLYNKITKWHIPQNISLLLSSTRLYKSLYKAIGGII